MRCAVAFGFALTLTVPGVALAQAAASGDEGAVRTVIRQHDQTRTTGDWKGVAALYVEDGGTLTSSGEWRRVYKGAKYATTVETVRTLAPTVAIADGTFEISNIAGGKSRKGNITYILVKSGDTWRIAATRSMVPTPAGPTPAR